VAQPIRVLLVDDEPIFLEAVRALLDLDARVTVVGASDNGEQALALAQREQPEVALVDVRLPTMDGAEITRRLLAQDTRLKVIALTGAGDEDTTAALRAAGATHFLVKGGLHDEIVDSIVAAASSEQPAETRA
jgi:DNA-binding NarL/FixJ family response regulator